MAKINTIKIQTETPAIPIELGELEFKFSTTDESIKKFRDGGAEVIKKLNELGADDTDDFEATKEVLRTGFDFILDEGAFDLIYEQTPSVIICIQYFEQLVKGIGGYLDSVGLQESQMEKAQKYVKSKKK